MKPKSIYPLLIVLFAASFTGCPPVTKSNEKGEDKKAKTGEAKVGVGKKGSGYGENVPILKPAATFWKAKEKIVFDILIPKNMQLFEATHGRKPSTQKEFMDEIIGVGKVELPQLEEGLEYFYDPKTGKLMVRNQAAKEESGKQKASR